MQENDIIDVHIEGFSNLGFGIARVDGFVIFVEGACPEDFVKIKLIKVAKNYANAKVIEVIKPSIHRIKPFCPMQKVCGACNLQFIDYDYQLRLKQDIVKSTIKTIGNLDIEIPTPILSPKIRNYRQKIQYPVSQTKNSKRLLAGYYKPKTHEIVNIKYCPIQPEICDEIIEFIRQKAFEYGITGYNEKTHSGDLRHIVIRGSEYSGKFLVTLVINKNYENFHSVQNGNFISLTQEIYDNFKQVTGVCINFNNKKTNVILGDRTKCVVGESFIEEKILDKVFKIGAQTFFQVNPKSAENIFKYVKDEISKLDNPIVLDAYAGISAFGIVVSDVSKQVVSIEENYQSCELAKESLKINGIKNVEINCGDAAEFLDNEKRKFDAIILDPPRKGCTKSSLDSAMRLGKRIIYVSCNPATLARDLKYLTESNCKVKSIQPFDMFCHTYHIENVAVIEVDTQNNN